MSPIRRAWDLLSRRKLWQLIIAFFLLYLALSVLRHLTFHSGSWDLGIFDQAVWRYSRFQVAASTVRGIDNLLGDHFHPLLVAFAPLYWVKANPVMLLAAQSFLLAIAAVPVHRVSRMKLGDDTAALAVALAYLSFWGIFEAAMFDFHPTVMMVPLLAFAYQYLEERKKAAFLVTVALMLLVEEDMLLTVFGLGVYLVLFRSEWRRVGVAVCAGSLAVFFVVTQLVIPSIHAARYSYWEHYAWMGPGIGSAALRLLTHPHLLLQGLFWPGAKILLLLALLGPFLFLPLAGGFSVVGLPYLLQRLLSDYGGHWSFSSHYNAIFGPILVIGAVEGFLRLRRRRQAKAAARGEEAAVLPARALLALPAVSLLFLGSFLGVFIAPYFSGETARAAAGYEMLRDIPGDAPVLAQHNIVPHLSRRDEIYLYGEEPFREGLSHTNLDLRDLYRERDLVSEVDYVALNPELDSFPTTPETVRERCEELRADPRFIAHDYGHGWVLFERVRP